MFDDLKQYINNRITYTKLEVVDLVSNMLSAGVFGILVGMFVMLILFIGSVSLGFFIGNWLDDTGLGFLILMGIYILILLLFLTFRKSILRLITDKAIVAAMDAMDNSDDDSKTEA